MARTTRTFHNAATVAADGTVFPILGGQHVVTVEISGTSSSRTVDFKGCLLGSTTYISIPGFNATKGIATSTTGTAELWVFDVSGLRTVMMDLSAVAGGNVTVKGAADEGTSDNFAALLHLATILGEVQASPTANTLLARLKTLDDDDYTRQIGRIGYRPFKASVSITRSSTVTAYAINQIVNASAATTLPAIDLTTDGAAASQRVEINSVSVVSSNGGAATLLSPRVFLLNAAPTGQTLTDYTAWAPTNAAYLATREARFSADELGTAIAYGANAYEISLNEISRIVTLDANKKITVALLAKNAYTPANAEVLTILVEGKLL